jgi:hypothetical protein
MLASVTAQAAICKYSSAPRERTTNQRGGLDRGFCLFNNGTYMLVRNNNKYKTFQFQPRQQQHPKQGTPHSWIFFFYSLHSTLQSRDPSRICRILFLFRALEGVQVSGSVACSGLGLICPLLRRTRLLHLTTRLSHLPLPTLSILTLPIHRCSRLRDSDRCPECARRLFECLSACLHARISLTATTTTTTTTCRRARLTWTRRCRRRAA